MATPLTRGRHWVYLDEDRTHELHALVDQPRIHELVFTTTEFPVGSREATEAITAERVLTTNQELQLAFHEIEQRLALSGTYYRADVSDMKWTIVAPPSAARKLDLRAHEIALPGGLPGAKMGFHHFHASEGGRDRLLVTLPRQDLGGTRAVLAQLDFDFPNVENGALGVLHPRLAPGTLRSQLALHHMELPTQGFAKLIEPRDYERAYGKGWIDRTRETFKLAAARVLGWDAPAPKPDAPLPMPGADDVAAALKSPRVQRVQAAWLGAGELEALMQMGELSIRRFVQQKRKRVDHHGQYDLAVLEASLLVEYGLRAGSDALLAEEGGRLVRFAMPTRG